MLSTILGALGAVGTFLISPQGIGVGIGVIILSYVLKKIDNKWVYKPIYGVFYGAGVACTLGASKWAPKIWNKTLEPFIVDLLDNVFSAIKNGLFDGLHSDNK